VVSNVRASNEGSLRPRVARAQGIARLPFHSPLYWNGVAKVALDCAHRTSTFLSCAFCEKEGYLSAPCSSFRDRTFPEHRESVRPPRPHPLLFRANCWAATYSAFCFYV
jgi:hypothetical protein